MHLDLIEGPFVPHNLISTQENPVTLLKIQMAHRLKIFMSSGSKKWTQIYISFLSKIPTYEPHAGSTTGTLWRDTGYRALFIFLENPIKIPLNKKALSKKRPSMCSKAGPLWEQTSISEPYLTYLSCSSVTEPSLKVPFMEFLAKKCPIVKPSFIYPSKSSVYEPPSWFQVPLGWKGVSLREDLTGTVLSEWFS